MLASLSGNMQQTMVMQMVQQVGRCGGICGVFFLFPDSERDEMMEMLT